MTTRLSVGITRKVGQPNYGSACATCQLEVEIDNRLITEDQQTLTDRIRRTFEICRREVDQELSGHLVSPPRQPDTVNGYASHSNGTPQPKPSPSPTRQRPATEAQVRAIHSIASKANVRLASQLDADFGVSSPQSLTLKQASELIEKLKSQLPTS